MARLYNIPQFFDDSGNVLNGGKIYTYLTGTSTNKATYKDQGEGTAHANPIILDSDGRPPSAAIWLLTDAEYRLVLKDSADVTLQTIDDVAGTLSPLHDAIEFEGIQFDNNKGISDDAGNEQLFFNEVASAVNYFNMTNSATGSAVILEPKGSDTNISLNIKSKGTGTVQVNGTAISAVSFRGLKYGITLANNAGDAARDIDFAVGTATDSSATVVMNFATLLVKQIDAGWVAGTNQGGLPGAVSLLANTWYHCFVIQHTNGTVDAGYDTSLTAANLLTTSAYTYYRRVGSVRTDGSSNILAFTQYGDEVVWAVPVQDVATANPGTSAVSSTIRAPTGVRTVANVIFAVLDISSAASIYGVINTPDQTDTAASATNFSLIAALNGATDDTSGDIQANVLTNTTSQVRYRLSSSDADITAYINTFGYRELWQ